MIKYREGYKYQLVETYSVQTAIFPSSDIVTERITLTKLGMLIITEGYAWDGCSGPTKDDKTNMRGGLVHDALCQLGRAGLLDEQWFHACNEELKRICAEDGMKWFRRWYYFEGVEDFGMSSFKKGSEPYPILIAGCD